MSTGKDLRIELRARNNALWHAIFDVYPSVSAFCRLLKLNAGYVGGFLNITRNPRCANGTRLTADAQRISDALFIDPDVLFPRNLYELGGLPTYVVEVDSMRVRALLSSPRYALPPTQEVEIQQGEIKEQLRAALSTLTARESEVLRRRFGLEGDEEKLEDIAQTMGVSHARVCQIEAKALRKLRHPSRSRQLLPHLESVDSEGRTFAIPESSLRH